MSNPTPEVQNFMENVRVRLKQYGGVDQLTGTAYLTDLGAVVYSQTSDGMTGVAVYTEDQQLVGNITSEGKIIYA